MCSHPSGNMSVYPNGCLLDMPLLLLLLSESQEEYGCQSLLWIVCHYIGPHITVSSLVGHSPHRINSLVNMG